MAGNETVPALATVYAREDYGVLVVGTRWEPHRVFCTQRPRGRRGAGYVVKYRRSDAESAAALISEVVCYGLLRRLGVRTLSAVLVEVTPAFIRASMRQGLLEYEIEAGLHFGTVFRSDVDALNPEVWQPSFWGELAEPEELVAIWAADSWLMNLDRGVYGNLLREQNPEGKWHLIAADQSDCFLGAGALADGTCFARSRHHGPAAYLPLLERTLLTQGTRPLQEMVERIRATVPSLPAAAVLVPEEWWRQAGVSAAAVIDCLGERAARIDRIVEAEKWKDYHMSQKADDCSGYSGAALRYLVDAAREVTMPVGVLLWSRASQQIWFRLPREGERVEGVHLAAAQPFLVAAQEKIEGWHRLGRLPYAKAPLEPLSVAWWEQVRGLLQWSVHLGPVHSLAGGDPEAELEALYQRTVEPQPAGRERLRRLEAAVERALGPALSERFQRHPTVPGFGGRPVPVLRQAADDRRAVIVEAVNLAAATAEKEADALASRLASIRKGESEGEIRFVLGYLAPAKERAGERALRAWIEHVSGAALFDLQEEAEAFHAAAAASLAELKEPLERDEVARVTATRARPRPAVRRGSRKSTARPRS